MCRQPAKDGQSQPGYLQGAGIVSPKLGEILQELSGLVQVTGDASGISDPVERYYHSWRTEPSSDPDELVVAKESSALRSIVPWVNNHSSVECILDPGCHIIAMSKKSAMNSVFRMT